MKTNKIYQIVGILLIFVQFQTFLGCEHTEKAPYELQKSIDVEQGAVVSAHPEASKIGLAILKAGGNAIDAAIATHFALSVCYPIAGNIGGGGFMIYRDNDGTVNTLDYREKAPNAAYETMYQNKDGEIIPNKSTLGYLAVGVPGSVDGMYEAFQKYSQLKDWAALITPSIELAKNGFKLTERQAKNLNRKKSFFQAVNTKENPYASDKIYKTGELFTLPELAATLRQIRDHKRAGFYEGTVAENLVKEMKKNGGIITMEDLKNYHSVWREPISFDYKNLKVYSMAPPSSGGILLAQLFHAIEPQPLSEWGFQDPRTIHLMVEAEKRSYADRAKHMGDSDFYDVPVNMLISKEYSKKRMNNFSTDKASNPDVIKAGTFIESEETTHLSVVDKEGNSVSITTTLNAAYGSKVYVDGGGYILNNEMDDFSSKVGVPNLYGLVGAEANKIEPGKRMLSSMTPTIVEKDGELYIVIGSPGGSTIITSVFQSILNIYEFGMTPAEAINAPRFHHQWKPHEVFYEKGCLDENQISALSNLGHKLKERGNIGRVEAIVVENGMIKAAADIRGDDDAEGY